MFKKLSVILILCVLSQAQELKPTELESAKLGKLKAQLAALQFQEQVLSLQFKEIQELKASKFSELLGQSEKVIKAHVEKDGNLTFWKDAHYYPNCQHENQNCEDGEFVQEKKEEKK